MAETILALLIAIRAVESSNGLDSSAYGNEYQITSVCVQDVNRIYHTKYRWPQDVRNRETAEDIVVLYLTYYGTVYKREYGVIPSRATLARIYNKGYDGMRRGEGYEYARKITKASAKKGADNGRSRRHPVQRNWRRISPPVQGKKRKVAH